MHGDQSVVAFLAIGGFLLFILLVITIILYVLGSFGLYKLAQNRKIDNPWLAWIPIAELYILGKLIKNLKIDTFEIPSIELVLPSACVAVMVFRFIPFIGFIINIAYIVLCLFALYNLYKIYRPQQATLWIILSIVLPFMAPIFIFIMRDDRLAI